MPLDWNDLGEAPAEDVPEISVFGPGYGESILAHVGSNEWLIVDSCVDSQSGSVAPLTYLQSIGVDPGKAVRFVIASHWHDDHVRGLSAVVRQCRNAIFVSAKALTTKEFLRHAARHAIGNASVAGSGVNEFHQIHGLLHSRLPQRTRMWARPDRRLHQFRGVGSLPGCELWSLSPSDEEFSRFLDFMAVTLPSATPVKPKRRAVTQGPNDTSVVIALDWGAASALLGSDLEAFPVTTRGWGAVVNSMGRPQRQSAYVKVPHHGGHSAHHDDMWSRMLLPNPTAVVTPFLRGRGLPSISDRQRICALTTNAYITAPARAKPTSQVVSDRAVEKMLSEAKIVLRQSGELGLVRARFITGAWTVQLFNHAHPLGV